MRKIHLMHNPYTLETKLTVDGREWERKPSELDSDRLSGRRIQEWIDKLPNWLVHELNESEFELCFKGTQMDYDDLRIAVSVAEQKKGIKIELSFEPGRGNEDRINEIKELYKEIQSSQYMEFREERIEKAFKRVLNGEFPIAVVGTMSAGKSTLINALIGQKIMPSDRGACTAIITEIHDKDGLPNFSGEAFSSDGGQIGVYSDLDADKMRKLNEDEKVSKLVVRGDIPFVDSSRISLVLVDTPGPNNARTVEHREKTFRMMGSDEQNLVLYISDGPFESTDNDDLLEAIAENMKKGGVQSRDRFVFVMSKMDDGFEKGGETPIESIKKAKDILEERGIHDPLIFPVSALTALNLRTILKDVDLEQSRGGLWNDSNLTPEQDTAVDTARSLILRKELHLDEHAYLPDRACEEMKKKVEVATKRSKDKDVDATRDLALYHSGVPALEEEIRIYLEKYAIPMKIADLVRAFRKDVDVSEWLNRLDVDAAKSESERKEIEKKLRELEEEMTYISNGIQEDIKKVSGQERTKRSIASLKGKSKSKCDELTGKKLPLKTKMAYGAAESLLEQKKEDIEKEFRKLRTNLESKIRDSLEQFVKEFRNVVSERTRQEDALYGVDADEVQFGYKGVIHTQRINGKEYLKPALYVARPRNADASLFKNIWGLRSVPMLQFLRKEEIVTGEQINKVLEQYRKEAQEEIDKMCKEAVELEATMEKDIGESLKDELDLLRRKIESQKERIKADSSTKREKIKALEEKKAFLDKIQKKIDHAIEL